MTTLTKISFETKFIVKWGSIVLFVFLVIYFGIKIGKTINQKLNPAPPSKPTVSFGKLPPIQFPQNQTDKNLTYSINTLSGKLPVFPDRINVYKLSENKIGFLSLERIQNAVSKLGITGKPYPVSENIYQWIDTLNGLKRISVNLNTSDMEYSTSFIADPLIAASFNLPTKESATQITKNFLENLNSFPNDIDESKTKIFYKTINNYILSNTDNPLDAQIIQVNFFQKDIDNLPIYYPQPNSSIINLLVDAGNNPQVVEANYYHKNVSNESATYPIKSAEEAFSDLKRADAYIASNQNNEDTVKITNVFPAYYADKDNQGFLIPIIVFEDDNGFIGYVSAIKDEWVSK